MKQQDRMVGQDKQEKRETKKLRERKDQSSFLPLKGPLKGHHKIGYHTQIHRPSLRRKSPSQGKPNASIEGTYNQL